MDRLHNLFWDSQHANTNFDGRFECGEHNFNSEILASLFTLHSARKLFMATLGTMLEHLNIRFKQVFLNNTEHFTLDGKHANSILE